MPRISLFFVWLARVLLVFGGMFFLYTTTACFIPAPPLPEENHGSLPSKDSGDSKAVVPKFFADPPYPQGQDLPKVTHLTPCQSDAECGSGIPPSGGKQICLNFSGTPSCFFPCDPKKADPDKQNPDCLAPETCIRLNDGSGACAYFPGLLYGIGTYKGIVSHPPHKPCLLRFGGCVDGHICVDTRRHGSVGTCEEACQLATDANSKNQPACKTEGTTCKMLLSGIGACLK